MTDRKPSITDELVFRYIKDRVSEPESSAVDDWRRAAPENEAHFRCLERLLGASAASDAQVELPAPPSLLELTGAARPSRFVLELPVIGVTRSRPRLRRPAVIFAALSTAAAALVVFVLQQFGEPESGPRVMQLAAAEYITGPGESAVVTLGDGSVVRLAPESRLRVTPRDDRREVTLNGRAFFAITSNPDMPFIVETPSGRTRVLGTRFDLESRGSELRVVVVEGRVELTTPAGSVELGAQEFSLATPGHAPGKTRVDAVDVLLDWLGHFIVFQATPLGDVAQEIEQRFGTRVQVTDPDLARETVTGWSNSQDALDILSRVCLAVNARCELSDTLAVIQPYR